MTRSRKTPSPALLSLSEDQQIAFFGCLMAVAFIDGFLHGAEFRRILRRANQGEFSERVVQAVQKCLDNPPRLKQCLEALTDAPEEARLGILIELVDVAWIDDALTPEEDRALHEAAGMLGVTADQLSSIREFVGELRKIRGLRLDDRAAEDRKLQAIRTLERAGIPASAAFFQAPVG